MLLLLIGIIVGVFIGYKINDPIKKLSEGIELKLFGYNISIIKNKKVVPFKNKMNLDFNRRNSKQKNKNCLFYFFGNILKLFPHKGSIR